MGCSQKKLCIFGVPPLMEIPIGGPGTWGKTEACGQLFLRGSHSANPRRGDAKTIEDRKEMGRWHRFCYPWGKKRCLYMFILCTVNVIYIYTIIYIHIHTHTDTFINRYQWDVRTEDMTRRKRAVKTKYWFEIYWFNKKATGRCGRSVVAPSVHFIPGWYASLGNQQNGTWLFQII